MFGLLLIFLSSIFGEAAGSIGKREVALKKETIYSLGFLDLLWGTAFFFAYALATDEAFRFSLESLPTFLSRAFIELFLVYFALRAIVVADRSTFSFLRVITVPLLLGVDLALGYSISTPKIIGICTILAGFGVLYAAHGIRFKGAGYALGSSLLAVITISLYKYDITHYNSVVAEQGLMSLIIMVFYFFMSRVFFQENPFRLLATPVIFIQSFSSGVGSVFGSFAYLFAPASVILTANRCFSLLTSIVAGNLYFKEKHFAVKCVCFIFMAVGIGLLAF